MVTGTAILLCFLPVPDAFGQVNVEDQRLSRDSSGFGGSVNLTVEVERGNSDLTEIGLEPRLAYRAGPSIWFMLNSYTFVETGDQGVVNEGFTHLRYNYALSQTVAAEALAQFQYNREQQLKRRYLLGSGVRLRLVDRKATTLALGFIAMYEYEKLETGEIVENARNSDYIAVRIKVTNTMSLSNTVYLQPLFGNPRDIRVLDNLQASFALKKWLAVTVGIKYLYDSRPPDGVKEYDFSLKNGLMVRF